MNRMSSQALASAFALAATLAAGTAAANETLQKASADPGQWVMQGRTYDNARFSPLDAINAGNVKNLKVAYMVSLGALRSNESTPIVVGDTLFVSSSGGPKAVFAVEAGTGKVKWRYEPDLPEDMMQYACCDVNSRGVSYAEGRIFVGRLDGNVVALDAKTGKEVWKTTVVDYKQGSVITSPPLVVKDLVITGFGGGEYGARGYISAYEQATGKLKWRFYTVPGPGEPGNDTWKGDSWKFGGGVSWLVGSYDPATNTVFYGTSNPGPWNTAVRGPGNGDYGKYTNLYTASTIALDADTGKLKFHLQHTPYDAWDYDGVNELVLADIPIGGKKTPVFMKADRNGFFYVADRTNGKLISAEAFVPVNWAKGIDVASTRPIEIPEMRPTLTNKASGVCPNLLGGKNWQPMSYNPGTGLVYIPAQNFCMDMKDLEIEYKRGIFYLGKDFATVSPKSGPLGEIVAWDPVAQKKVWSIKERFPFNGGTLSTAGNLMFYGSMEGMFKAVDAKSGEVLWSFNVGTGVGAGPITFTADGKQYVAVVVGRTAGIPPFMGDIGKEIIAATPEGGALVVFGL